MRAEVSVLMTVYNAENFLEKSISSIINQTFKNWELIIVDDYSNDRSLKIIKKFKKKNIKTFKLNKKLGRTKSLNYGLNKCSGKYVAILDADDFSKKNRLEKQYNFLKKNNDCGLVATWYRLIFLNQKFSLSKKFFLKNEIVRKYLFINPIAHSSIMFLKSLAVKLGKYPNQLKYAQDWGLILKFMKHSKVKVLNEFLVNITIVKGSMTFNNKYKEVILKDYKKNLSYILNNFDINLIERLIIYYFYLKNKVKLIILKILKIKFT